MYTKEGGWYLYTGRDTTVVEIFFACKENFGVFEDYNCLRVGDCVKRIEGQKGWEAVLDLFRSGFSGYLIMLQGFFGRVSGGWYAKIAGANCHSVRGE